MDNQEYIRQRLVQIKKIITKDKNGETFSIIPRDKNKNFMREYGLQLNDVKKIILALSVVDYIKGPEKDEGGYAGEVWFYAPRFCGIKLYVKLRIQDNKIIVCISIHENGLY